MEQGKIEKDYKLKEVLGIGTYGVVRRGVHKRTGENVAIKVIIKPKILYNRTREQIETEISILSRANHPNIIPFRTVYQTHTKIFIVMRLIKGGELFEQLISKGSFPEKDVAFIIQHILRGIEYLHSIDIVHRDIKPQNILCEVDQEKNIINVFISDFGLSKITQDAFMKSVVGTPHYIAPEILKKNGYTKAIDIWSVGCIMYNLLSGLYPFSGNSPQEIMKNIATGKVVFYEEHFGKVSAGALDLVFKLLLPQEHRPTAGEALKHQWFQTIEDETAAGFLRIDASRLQELRDQIYRMTTTQLQNSDDCHEQLYLFEDDFADVQQRYHWDDEDLPLLLDVATLCSYSAGQIIQSESEQEAQYGVIKSGTVSIQRILGEDHKLALADLGPREAIGTFNLAQRLLNNLTKELSKSSLPSAPLYSRATTEVEVYRISYEALQALVYSTPRLCCKFWRRLAIEFTRWYSEFCGRAKEHEKSYFVLPQDQEELEEDLIPPPPAGGGAFAVIRSSKSTHNVPLKQASDVQGHPPLSSSTSKVPIIITQGDGQGPQAQLTVIKKKELIEPKENNNNRDSPPLNKASSRAEAERVYNGEGVLIKLPAKWSLKPLMDHLGSLTVTKQRLVLRASFFALRFYANIPFERINNIETSSPVTSPSNSPPSSPPSPTRPGRSAQKTTAEAAAADSTDGQGAGTGTEGASEKQDQSPTLTPSGTTSSRRGGSFIGNLRRTVQQTGAMFEPPPLRRGKSTAAIPTLSVEEFLIEGNTVKPRHSSILKKQDNLNPPSPTAPPVQSSSFSLNIFFAKKDKGKVRRMKIILRDNSMAALVDMNKPVDLEFIKRLWLQNRDSRTVFKEVQEVTSGFYNIGALTEHDWNQLLSSTHLSFFRKDEVIIEEGQVNNPQLYFIHKGHCRVEQLPITGPSEKKAVMIGIVRPREIFGEISFLSKYHRATASVVANDESVCLSIISGDHVNRMLRASPEFGGRFYHYLCQIISARLSFTLCNL